MARERRGKLRKPTKVGDLKARAAPAGAVKGGFVIDWTQQTGADRPGETQGVIAIIKPGGTTR